MAAWFEMGDRMRRWWNNLRAPSAAAKAVGLLMVEESLLAFSRQRFGSKAWLKRKSPNVFGIIADFSQGDTKQPPKRRFEDKPALRDKGRLMGSITYRLVSNRAVEVGSWLKYAGKHHRGEETESLPITKQVQERLWKWLKKQPKTMRRQLGWLLNAKYTGKTLRMRLPERPLVGITKDTRAAIAEVVKAKITTVE